MEKLLGIDYGEKRVGLAIAEDSWAKSFVILINESRRKTISAIKDIVAKEEIKRVIFGLPRTFSGKESERLLITKKFGELLASELDVPVEFISEIFTSKLAKSSAKTKLQKKNVDDRAACYILENYIERAMKIKNRSEYK
jgi:putative holliday junction resolvase